MAFEPEILNVLRARVDALHPPGSLRTAVLRDLPEQRPSTAGVPARPRALVALVAGLAAVAALVVPTVLRRDGDGGGTRPTLSTPAPGAPDVLDLARARNLALYEREKERLHRDLLGKWVLIADRAPEEVEGAFKPLLVGDTLESVAALAPDAKHRFVFRVGDEGDVTTVASAWHAPRSAGSGFVRATGLTSFADKGGGVVELRKGEAVVTFHDASPFPRIRVGIERPSGPSPAAPEAREVLLGTVGPTLALAPADDERLGLARWEVPGTEIVGGVPCRRVLVRVSIPELEIVSTVVAAVPDVAPERLVAQARERGAFWRWTEGLPTLLDFGNALVPAGKPRWLVFGNDRVLGVGSSAETALAEASAYRDVIYHRYVTPWPRPADSAVEHVFGLDAILDVGGVRAEARVPSVLFDPSVSSEVAEARHPVLPVFVPRMTEADWLKAGLALAEDPAEVMSDEVCPPGSDLRAAYARVKVSARDAPSETRERFARIVAFVVPREAQRTITLTKGDTIHVESGPGGGATITVIVEAGKKGAGSYSSSSPHLREAADEAARTLADPNTETRITVDGTGALVSISSTVTKR